MNITRFVVQNGDVVGVGTVTGISPTDGSVLIAPVTIPVVRGPQPGSLAAPATPDATCPILHLVLGPLHLDLLGLVIDLNQVVLNISAVSAPGNLLGNLLCAITNLLNGTGPLGQLAGLLNELINLLNSL